MAARVDLGHVAQLDDRRAARRAVAGGSSPPCLSLSQSGHARGPFCGHRVTPAHRLARNSPPKSSERKLSELLANVSNQPRWQSTDSTAATMCAASMPAAASSASGGPLPGRSVTARRTSGVPAPASARTPATVSPMPPSAQWSSTVTSALVSAAAVEHGVGVDRLDRVEVDHPGRDPLPGELVGGGRGIRAG